MPKISRRLLGIKKAASLIDVSPSTLRTWCYQGKISSHRIGARRLISMTELDRLIRESELPRVVALSGCHEAAL